MNGTTLNRRDVTRLALAALGGLVTGALVGCGGNPTTEGKTPADTGKGTAQGTGSGEKLSRLLEDPHVCRGINTCKNKGKKGTANECAAACGKFPDDTHMAACATSCRECAKECRELLKHLGK